jgi:predicted phage tail protein
MTNTPDSLRSFDEFEVILALGEGPMEGLRNGNKSFFVGDTPLENGDSSSNFTLFSTTFFPGDNPADIVTPTLGGFSNNTQVGVTLATQTSVTRQTQSGSIDYIDVRLVIPQLYEQDSHGNVSQTAVTFRIEYKPANAGEFEWSRFWGNDITISGKTTTNYVKEFRQAVLRMTCPYDIRVTKISGQSTTTYFAEVVWESFQEIVADKKAYNDTAIIQINGQATDQLNSIPEFSGVYRGLKILVPTNYDPIARTYTGLWDGTFKRAWSNNPAWILYDFISNARYGVSAYYPVTMDRYDCYSAAQWCDQLVDDGFGGQQPRYTMNLSITDAQSGKDLVRYLAGAFNACIIDNLDGTCGLLVDKDDDAVALFTRENVANGAFEYTYTDLNTRYNDITVTFLNPDLDWQQDTRRVFDQDSIDANGSIPLPLVAVGVTNAAEAIRRANYKLITSLTEKEGVSFTTNRQGQFVKPWDIILVADPDMGYSISGRIRSISTDRRHITVRDAIYLEVGFDYTINIQYAGQIVTLDVLPVETGLTTTLAVTENVPTGIPDNAVFSLGDSAGGALGLAKPYRVMKVSEVDGSPDQFQIEAIEINRNKFNDADTLSGLTPPQYSKAPFPNIAAPTNLAFLDVSYTATDGTFMAQLRADWTAPPGVLVGKYEVQYKLQTQADFDGTLLVNGTDTFIVLNTVRDRHDYDVRVRAVSVMGATSDWLVGSTDGAIPNDAPPGQPTALSAVGGFRSITLNWANPSDTDLKSIEVFASQSSDVNTAAKIGEVAGSTYIHGSLGSAVTYYYWVRAVDRSGNHSDFNSNLGTSATTVQLTGTDVIDKFIDGSKLLADLTNAVIGSTEFGFVSQAVMNLIGVVNQRFLDVQQKHGDLQRSFVIVDNNISTITTDLQAEVDQRTILGASVAGNTAAITTESLVRAGEDSVLASKIDALTGTVNSNSAAITNEQTLRVSGDSALASSISSVSTTVAGHTTSITQNTTSIDGLQGKYTVKIDANGYVAGFGLAVDANDATPTSSFIINADYFAIAKPGGGPDPIVPFLIDTNTGGENELVFRGKIKADSIDTYMITTDKIAIGAVDTTTIASQAVTTTFAGENLTTYTLSTSSYTTLIELDSISVTDTAYNLSLSFSAVGHFSGSSGGLDMLLEVSVGGGSYSTVRYWPKPFAFGQVDGADSCLAFTIIFTPSSTGSHSFRWSSKDVLASSTMAVEDPTATAVIFKR